MEENKERTQQDSALIEGRAKIAMAGVASVDGFSSSRIDLTLTGGGRAQVTGENLKIVAFSRSGGTFSAVGRIGGLRYTGGQGKLAGKLFR